MSIKKLFDGMTFKEKVILIYSTIFLALSILFYIFKEYDFINYILISIPFITLCILLYIKNIFIENDFSNGFFIGMILFAYAPIIGLIINNEHIEYITYSILTIYISTNILVIIILIIIKRKIFNKSISNKFYLYIILNTSIYLLNLFTFINYNFNKLNFIILECVIIDKNIIPRTSKGSSVQYNIKIKNNEFLGDINNIKVIRDLYYDKNINDTILIEYHKGGLNLPWFKVSNNQNSN